MRQAAALSASEARLERQLADTAARKDEALEDARTTQALRLQEEQVWADVCVCVCARARACAHARVCVLGRYSGP